MPNQDQNPSASSDSSSKPKVTVLAPIVDVRRGEVVPMFTSALWIFLALTAYYIIKPIRGTVLQDVITVDNKPRALLATTIFIGFFVYVYGKIVPRVTRQRLIIATFLAFIGCLCAFAIVMPLGGTLVGYLFYVWVSTFNLMVVSQFWSLAADVWSKEEGSRLFGFIGVGAVGGGIFGTVVVSGFAKTLDTYQMLFLAAGILGVCLLLALYILRFGAQRGRKNESTAASQGAGAKAAAMPGKSDDEVSNPFVLVFTSPYLRLIAVMMLIVNLVNTSNEWIFDKLLSQGGLGKAELNAYYAQYYLYQNVLTFCIQFFLTARIQRWFGARVALLFLPLVGLTGGVLFLAIPTLFVIRSLKIAENATEYSIQANTRELLYLPVSKVEKYSAKNLNDTLIVRIGDSVAAGAIFLVVEELIPRFGDGGIQMLVGTNLFLGAILLFVVFRIGGMHRVLMRAMPNPSKAAADVPLTKAS